MDTNAMALHLSILCSALWHPRSRQFSSDLHEDGIITIDSFLVLNISSLWVDYYL